ncbi:MAG: hypothetical protein H6512_07615 [Acidimicrobiia bacterium]|nr:hypothetical protein [Acidimicrobiia bacterium]
MYVKNDPSTTRRPHIPAFDGLRALAVSAVLAFHNGFEWIQGGFLGVSLFFTLSGLLITSVLLSSWLTGPTATVVPHSMHPTLITPLPTPAERTVWR